MTFMQVTHPDDVEADWAHGAEPAGGADRDLFDGEALHPQGRVAGADRADGLAGARQDGEPSYFVSVIRDVAKRKQAEEAAEGERGAVPHPGRQHEPARVDGGRGRMGLLVQQKMV